MLSFLSVTLASISFSWFLTLGSIEAPWECHWFSHFLSSTEPPARQGCPVRLLPRPAGFWQVAWLRHQPLDQSALAVIVGLTEHSVVALAEIISHGCFSQKEATDMWTCSAFKVAVWLALCKALEFSGKAVVPSVYTFCLGVFDGSGLGRSHFMILLTLRNSSQSHHDFLSLLVYLKILKWLRRLTVMAI